MKKPRPKKFSRRRKQVGRGALQSAATNPFSASELKAALILWLGAITASLTLFGSLQTFLDVADWARYLATHWNTFMEYFWVNIFGFPKGASAPITFTFSLMMIAYGTALFAKPEKAHEKVYKKSRISLIWEEIRLPFTDEKKMLMYVQGFCIITTAMVLFRFLIEAFIFNVPHQIELELAPKWLSYLMFFTVVIAWLLVSFRLGWAELLHSVILTIFMVLFYVIIASPGAYAAKAAGDEQVSTYRHIILDFSVALMPGNLLGLLVIANVRQLNARFKYILLALLTILVLSALSSRGMSLKPPTN